jgi:pimeloyl-ACP methyl ester carboxylesterase
MTARRRAVALAIGALVPLAGCTASTLTGHGQVTGSPSRSASSAPTQLPPAPTPLPAQFQDCRSGIKVDQLGVSEARLADLSFECTAVSVPLDYAEPSGTQIQLVVQRVREANDTAPIGSLLVNPGGPGGSGVELALGILAKLPATILAHFDLVGFDPRGVGLSSPIDCLSDSEQDRLAAAAPDIRTAAGFDLAKSLAKQYADKCNAKYGADLAQYDTVQSARDMDQIRQAVGDDKLNYLGFSYGTELGAQYLHLFPHNVRVAVLDGAVDPLYGPLKSTAKQLKGFEDAFDQFAQWCPDHDPCSTIGDPRQAVYGIVAAARDHPLPAAGTSRQVTTSLVLTGVSEALYSRSDWPALGRALADAQDGAGKGLLDLADQYNQRFDGHYSNLFDAFNTISCNDSPPGPSDATIRAAAQKWSHDYPMFGLNAAASLFTCQQWQPDRTVPPLPTAKDSAATALVIGNLHDPATPYQGAKDLAKTLGNARLLSWDGEGHTSYLEGSTCVDDYVDAYLVDATLPPAGATCR